MKLHKFLAATALMLAVVLTLAPGAGAQGHFKVVYAFRGSDGQQPRAGLVFDVAGNLYLTTAAGGIGGCWFYGGYGCGTVVKLAPNPDGSWTESVLYTFTGGEDGGNPWSTLLFDAAGNLYGTTMYGGAYGNGAVFELSPTPDGSWTEGVLHSFIGADGAQPSGALTFDTAGNLYGTAENGGAYDHGALYTLTPNLDGTWTQQVLHSFTGGKDGARPSRNGALIFDAAGNLWTKRRLLV